MRRRPSCDADRADYIGASRPERHDAAAQRRPRREPQSRQGTHHTKGIALSAAIREPHLVGSVMADITGMVVRQAVTAPVAGLLQGGLAGGGFFGDGFGLFHEGGIGGERPPGVRCADPDIPQAR